MKESNRWRDKEGSRFAAVIEKHYDALRGDGDSGKALKDTSDTKAPPCVGEGITTAIDWYRRSAEMKAVYLEVYRSAGAVAQEASKHRALGKWGVVLDIDETLLDNSEYQKELAQKGQGYSHATFLAWLKTQKATVLPGAAEFVHSVNYVWHGKVVLVTNQTPEECEQTRQRLTALDIRYDWMLCDGAGTGDKNERFREVQNGDSGQHAPLDVVLWVGDSITDFPKLSQSSPGDLAQFGSRYFALPNPMYGSWSTLGKQ
jgi:5'-nucleotidase (lipoprotein e(P4) family)